MIGPTYYKLRIHSVVDETADAKSFLLDLPEVLAPLFRYKAGQFLTVRIPRDERFLVRCYSLASSPALEERLRLTVKRVPGGRVSNWMCDHLHAGDELEAQAPSGVFTPRSLEGPLLLFAGGCGITPLFSILRTALTAGQGRVRLIYANRDPQTVIFRDELNALADTHAERLQVVQWLDSVHGLPTPAVMAGFARGWEDASCFICGPAPFMATAEAALKESAYPSERIHVERFVSLPDEEPTAIAAVPGGNAVRLEVELEGQSHVVECSDQEPLLDAMLRAGVEAPNSCRIGGCASCRCRLEAGAVDLRRNEALSKRELAEGWTLACQAVPRTAHVRVRFTD